MIERDENGKLVWTPDRSVRPAPVKRTPSLRLVDMRKKLLEKQSEEKDRMAAELKERWDSSFTLSWGISSECSRRYRSAPCSAPLAVGRYCFARIKTLFK